MSGISVYVINRLIYQFSKPGYRRFKNSLTHVEAVQRKKLSELLEYAEHTEFGQGRNLKKGLSWEKFNETLPVTEYGDWEEMILRQKKSGGLIVSGETCARYQPTSGSTSRVKWIPYTKKFLSEIDAVVSPLIIDSYQREKRLFGGCQYWSLSWIPTGLRKDDDSNTNDDLEILPWWKKIVTSLTMAVPSGVSFAETSEGSMIATLAYMASKRNLAFISVWSPTFALNMFEQMRDHRYELAEILGRGDWCRWSKELSFLPCPKSKESSFLLKNWDGSLTSNFFEKLWPGMGLISSWATSTSKLWADELMELFPKATFVGKGLWATEGVITFSFEGKYPLAVTSHFYEFMDIESGDIYPSWKLQKGQVLKPLLTTGSGLFRYAMNDKIRVVDFAGTCPCFEFLGRLEGVDMVGEKMSSEIAQEIINSVNRNFDVNALTIFAVTGETSAGEKPRYIILCEKESDHPALEQVQKLVESLLLESFHYRLARDLNQLGAAEALFHPMAGGIYRKRAELKDMILGNLKLEPLVQCANDEWKMIISNFM
jgi:hypothetical protein